MAKALMGFVGGPTVEQNRETARLRRRVRELEAETLRLKIENDILGRDLVKVSSDQLLAPLAR